ncbi:hypothetical protein [Reinekea blandensis]|uniref:DNA replication terminus site-binding protein n=1 Tax=Reinekea blandensis MED297 TaxID=314283 RepID=A4BHM1_9GAMM|nr:hypothetical protein [Reinekea blandensis]EAR08419.1 hypothetical protein MED297_16804 [Reinekea blandensis MED297]
MSDLIFDRFEKLRNSMTTFARSVENDNRPIWLADWHTEPAFGLEPVLTDLWYHEDQDGRETRLYPGIVSLNHEQVTFANEINRLKDEFRAEVTRIKEKDSHQWRDIQGKLARRYQRVNEQLQREGLNRLHLKQLFRHIPLIVQRPEKVGFSWYTSGRSIKKITRNEAYDLLCKLNTDATHIKIQLERLAGIPEQEPLARVQTQAPVLRANMVFPDKKRRSMNVSLPIMFPGEGRAALPDFNVPLPTPPAERTRLVRSDNRIDDEPFLPSVRVHRYTQKPSFNPFSSLKPRQ